MTFNHTEGTLISDRYRILDVLGEGGSGITYRAEDTQTWQPVALKALSLRRLTDWKAIELFEREAIVLSQLQHPAIPCYLDYFHTDTEPDRAFYIVQQLAEGQLSNLLWLGGFALIGLWILTTFLYATLSRVRLELNDPQFHMQKWLLGSRYYNVKCDISSLRQVQLHTVLRLSTTNSHFTSCVLRLKWRKWAIGSCLTPAENAWLVQEIEAFLANR